MNALTIASLAIFLAIYIIMAAYSSKQSKKQTIKQSNMKQHLSKFGKVEQLEVKNGQFHCLITKGFKNQLPDISKCYSEACALAGEKYTQVVKHQIDDNYFHLILKPKN